MRVKVVSGRSATLQQKRHLSYGLSTSIAIKDHLRDWWNGTKPVAVLAIIIGILR